MRFAHRRDTKKIRGFTLQNKTLMMTACIKKKKIRKLEVAEKLSEKWGQYYYFCPICLHYHMTRKEQGQKGVITKLKGKLA